MAEEQPQQQEETQKETSPESAAAAAAAPAPAQESVSAAAPAPAQESESASVSVSAATAVAQESAPASAAGAPANVSVLVVYYSRTGVTKQVCNELVSYLTSRNLQTHSQELKDTKERNGVAGFLRATADTWGKNQTVLATTGEEKDLNNYTHVILAGPIWWYTWCTPLSAYARVNKEELKKKHLILLSTQGSSGHEKAVVAAKKELHGADLFANVVFSEKEVRAGGFKAPLHKFLDTHFGLSAAQ